VKRISGRIRLALFLRSFAVQGSWNYQTLIGTGFAFVLIPVLRILYEEDREAMRSALRRHVEVFNSHPYLATLAVGAVARLECEGAQEALIRRFKNALRGSLGSLGDRLVWAAWRPMSALLAIVVLLFGAPWWVGLIVFLVVYNALHLGLRSWGLRTGLREGLDIGNALRSPAISRWAHWASNTGALLAGFASVLAVSVFATGPTESGITALGILAGVALGYRVRSGIWVLLALVWVGGMVARMVV